MPTKLERQKEKAAEENDFEAWRRAYRAEKELAGNGGLINGVPASQVVNASQVESLPANPQARSNPDLVIANANRIGAARAAEQAQQAELMNNSYRSFLASVGEDPDTIGGNYLYTGPNARQLMDVTPLRDQEEETRAINRVAGMNTRNRIAARRLGLRGNGAAEAEILNNLTVADEARGGRSAEGKRSYIRNLQSQLRPIIQQQRQIEQSNGFSPSPAYAPTNEIGRPPARTWDWARYIA